MKNKVLGVMALGIFLLGICFVSAGSTESMTVTVDVFATEASISVPDKISFEGIAAGYISEAHGFELANIGNTAIRVQLSLDMDYTGEIFNNLWFATTKSGDRFSIENFSIEVEKPATLGEMRTRQLYAWLDLTEVENTIADNDHETEIIFTAVPA